MIEGTPVIGELTMHSEKLNIFWPELGVDIVGLIMLDFDLAMLYEVETRSLNQTVKRNARRFPNDFMFQLTEHEWDIISSQFVMTSRLKRPRKSLPSCRPE